MKGSSLKRSLQTHSPKNKKHNNAKRQQPKQEGRARRWPLPLVAIGSIAAASLVFLLIAKNASAPFLCGAGASSRPSATSLQLEAVLQYATSTVVPQQSLAEISVTFHILRSLAPTNFLVFGLGRDSLMWASLNPHGKTLFSRRTPMGPDNDRRAAGVFPGGAGEDGGDILGGGDGEEPEGNGRDALVPARRGPAVEEMYAEAFLCKKYRVKAEGRLWHFEIPPAVDINTDFC
ncbi:hypothetical protein SASPL_115939 [Salvia splendens]|uniref:Glucuronoxylan 4-O-methyltransferase n=1 Tax=Salvia splendens TaxID=180675 RepID=A0A8X9A2L9_SALSN|nr:hypothetical protein SASPL_115939 [Salvia splendens]